MGKIVTLDRILKEGEANPNIGYDPEGLSECLNQFVHPDSQNNRVPVYYIDKNTHDRFFMKCQYNTTEFRNLPKYGYVNDFNSTSAVIELTEYGEAIHSDEDKVQMLYQCDMNDGKYRCTGITALYVIGDSFLVRGGVNMKELKYDLLTTEHTSVFYEENFDIAPHDFTVVDSVNGSILSEVHFQNGPIKESGINGVNNEDLIAMVICRLEHFQKSEFICKENDEAIKKLEQSLIWLRKRTVNRQNRGVIGTHIK